MAKQKQQRGGTTLGFIVGAIVGLGAALAVALYVAKVPIPFMNKGAIRGAGQDALESDKNKNWNPNVPLYGKNPVRPVAPGVLAPTPQEPLPAPAPVAPAAMASLPPASPPSANPPSPPRLAEAQTVESADPLGDLARAKSSAAALDAFDYFVQAGAFRSSQEADGQRAKLAMMGWAAKVSEREQLGRTVYRVRVGPFGKKEDAEGIKEKFETAGVDSALVRVQR